MPRERASSAVASPDASSVRITWSTMSCGTASNVRRSVFSALYAGITTAMRRPLSIALVLLAFVDVETVQDAMDDGREHDRGDREHRKARIERVNTGEELAGVGLGRIHGTHAGKDHRGVEEGIEPPERFEPVVARDADR